MLTSFFIAFLVCAFLSRIGIDVALLLIRDNVLLMLNYSIYTKAFHQVWHYCIVVLIFIVSGPSGMYMFDSYISITIHNEYLV